MAAVLDHLRSHARILQRSAQGKDPQALTRLRQDGELGDLDESALAGSVRRRHCLRAIARELGFGSWVQARATLSGEDASDFGTLLYPAGGYAHWNIWSASYEEAKRIRRQHGGYLLAYRRQFFIVDRHFLKTFGLDPEDPDWEKIGRDWVRPQDPAARQRLYGKLIDIRLPNL